MSKNVKWKDDWLKLADENGDTIGLWVRHQGDFKGSCVWCRKDFTVRSGITNLRSHSSSEKHRTISAARRNSRVMSNLVVIKAASKPGQDHQGSDDHNAAGVGIGMVDACAAPRVAEIRCVVRIILKGHSFESAEDLAEDLQAICSDSKIPARMQLRSTKISYLLTEAIFPYMREVVLAEVRDAEWYALHLDEANNKGSKFLGIVVRYLPRDSFEVHTACIGLPSLKSTTAEHLAEAVSEMAVECDLKKTNCLAVMSDNCNVMRGAKSGVVVRLKNEHGFTSLVDVGGCSLHHIHNVARHACDASKLGVSVETLVREVYCHFKYSAGERERLMDISSEFEIIKKLVFLRPVETRWLQILSVVERVLNMFRPLVRYFSEQKPAGSGSNFASIKATLRDPKTEFFLCFLAEVLKPLQQFEMLFQQDGCHVHELYPQLLDLMKLWLLRFIKPACLPAEKFWHVDGTDISIQLSPYQIGIGERARRLFNDMSSEDQQSCLQSVRAFFATGTAKLRDYIPFDNKFLCACQVVNPQKQLDSHAVQWCSTLARQLPRVIPEADIASLQVEMRCHRHELDDVQVENHTTVAQFWGAVARTGKRPLLIRLIRALLVLPHGNAEVERIFSSLNDTVTKKRTSLAHHTVKALIVSLSCLRIKRWTAASLPVTTKLLNLCSSAHAGYCQRLRADKKAAEQARAKELEAALIQEVEAEKRASRTYASVQEELEEKSSEIERKIKEKEASRRLLEEVQKTAQTKERELEDLQRQQEKLQKKREKEAQMATEAVVKRAAIQLTAAGERQLPEVVRSKKFRIA